MSQPFPDQGAHGGHGSSPRPPGSPRLRAGWLSRLRRDEAGIALFTTAAALVVVLGVAALAIDLGILYVARTEAQRVADVAALAGAGQLLDEPDDIPGARQVAIAYAARNDIHRVGAVVLPEDVDVESDNRLVRVRVHRTADRGSAVRTFFARILGFDEMDVSTVAAARAFPAGGVNCLLPLAMPDRWSLGPYPELVFPDESTGYSPEAGHFYLPWDPDDQDALATGYGDVDRGTRILIKPGNPQQALHPGWFFPMRFPDTQGGAAYRDHITSCGDPETVWEVGMEVIVEPGNMIGPTAQGFRELIGQDPNAYWSDACNCVMGSDYITTPRIRPMAVFNPDYPPASGAQPFVITNFVGVFVEALQGNDVYVRFVRYTGVLPAAGDGATSGTLNFVIRLVE